MSFSSKVSAEVEYFGFNFTERLGQGEMIVSAEFIISSDSDTNAASMLYGPAIVAGTIVKQLVVNGTPGVTYNLTVTAKTSNGQVMVETEKLPISTAE